MANRENIISNLYNPSDFNSTTLFNSRVFSPNVPRGARGELKKARLTWGQDDGTALTNDITWIFGLIQGINVNDQPISVDAVKRLGIVMESALIQRVEGTPADQAISQTLQSIQRDFNDDPSKIANFLNKGARSNTENGWALVWWALGSALNIFYLATIEFDIIYANGKGNPDPLTTNTLNAMINQSGFLT